MPMHDWTKVEAGIYHAFHGFWLRTMARTLNDGLLPAGYYALPEQKSAGLEVDLLTLQGPATPTANGPVPTAGGLARPAPRSAAGVLEKEEPAPARKRPGRRLAIRHVTNHKAVAVIELVSPGNTDNRRDYNQFVAKAEYLLAGGVHLSVIDPFRPPAFAPAGLHAAIWKKAARRRKGRTPFAVPADRPLLAASYCASAAELTAVVEPFAVGEPVPAVPLYLTPDGEGVTVPLEDTYTAAWPDVPAYWRDVLEGG